MISLEESDKAWLDEAASREGIAMTEMVRRCVRHYRRNVAQVDESLDELLDATSGIWKGEDGLRHQEQMRREWER